MSDHSTQGDGEQHRPESHDDNLPSDETALKAMVGTMRIDLRQKEATITRLQEELDDVKASHSVVLQRSAEWQDELETLRLRVPLLDEQLRTEKQAREAEADRVKDLRMRAEESRRAIMRLQGEQSDARAKAAKADNRRSWVPTATTPIGAGAQPAVRDEQELAELKKSKRASLAFGPNSLNLNAIARATAGTAGGGGGGGHRRTASGSRSISGGSKGEGDDLDEPLSPTGLRGLRLSGIGGQVGSSSLLVPGDDFGSAPNSRRSSFRSDSGKSPTTTDFPLQPDTAIDSGATRGSRLALPTPNGGASRSAHVTSPAMSQGALSSVGVGSPILEDNEEADEVPKSLPPLPPPRNGPIGSSAQDRELKMREVEIERLTREVAKLRTSRQEAIDARQASEDCLNALRDFIATHDDAAAAQAESSSGGPWSGHDGDEAMQRASIGAGLLKGVKLPPLPTDDMDETTEAEIHAKSNSVLLPQKGFSSSWGVKLPNFTRRTTSSSTATGGATPGDENSGASTSTSNVPDSLSTTSTYTAPFNKSFANGLAGFGSLLTRVSPSAETPPPGPPPVPTKSQHDEAAAAAGMASTSPRQDETGSGFKSFSWLKRASMMNSGAPPPPVSAEGSTGAMVVEEKLLSPPFRSLDHDQLAIAHHLSPESELDPASGMSPSANGSSTGNEGVAGSASVAIPSRQSSSSFDSASARAARLDKLTTDTASSFAEHIKLSSQPELSYRAQKAAEKTSHVEHLTGIVPAFD